MRSPVHAFDVASNTDWTLSEKPEIELPLQIADAGGPELEAELLFSDVMRQGKAKFMRGQREHGGVIHQKPGMLRHAQDEALDLSVYLWTLRRQLQSALDLIDAEDTAAAREILAAVLVEF